MRGSLSSQILSHGVKAANGKSEWAASDKKSQ